MFDIYNNQTKYERKKTNNLLDRYFPIYKCNDTDNKFIEEFYKGINSVSPEISVIGGDITASKNDIYISITAIGSDNGRKISSRKNALHGYVIVTKGFHGSSAKGLEELLNKNYNGKHVLSHIAPELEFDFSKQIAENISAEYAMMDTSDGLADALFTISEASGVMMEIDFDKIPCDEVVLELENCEEYILYGGEDYGLVATVDDPLDLNVVGEVKEGSGIKINYEDSSKIITKSSLEGNLFDHFKE